MPRTRKGKKVASSVISTVSTSSVVSSRLRSKIKKRAELSNLKELIKNEAKQCAVLAANVENESNMFVLGSEKAAQLKKKKEAKAKEVEEKLEMGALVEYNLKEEWAKAHVTGVFTYSAGLGAINESGGRGVDGDDVQSFCTECQAPIGTFTVHKSIPQHLAKGTLMRIRQCSNPMCSSIPTDKDVVEESYTSNLNWKLFDFDKSIDELLLDSTICEGMPLSINLAELMAHDDDAELREIRIEKELFENRLKSVTASRELLGKIIALNKN